MLPPRDHDAPEPTATDVPPWRRRSHRWRWALLALVGLLAVGAVAAGAWVSRAIADTPSTDELRARRVALPSVLLSADGQVLHTFRRRQQQPVTLDEVAAPVVQALVATEDHRFYEHRGIDTWRTLAAVWHTLRGDTQGGSTITQQLARNLYPEQIGRDRSLARKLKEMVTARRLERAYDKRRILEAYLNSAPFLYNVVGIEMAARTYFDKPAAALDTLESATLVGMLKGTGYYNPVRHPERAKQRRNVVLAQMHRHGHLDEAQMRRLAAQPLALRFNRLDEETGSAPHFAEHVRKWLVDWAEQHDLNLYSDGLTIHTTLDSRLQRAATEALAQQADALQAVADVEWARPTAALLSRSTEPYERRRDKVEPFRHFWAERPALLDAFVRESATFRRAVDGGAGEAQALRRLRDDADFMAKLRAEKTRLEAGLLAMDPATGEVRAWVGSRDFARDQYDHVAQAQRQPGSTFKPLVYGAALEAGIGPDRRYVDLPFDVPLPDGTVWTPTDMGGYSGLEYSLRDGLALSKNTITAQLAQEVGVHRIVRLARAAGIDQSPLDAVPSLALGTSPVTLLEMVDAYATIAAVGERRAPQFVRRIVGRDGRTLAQFGAAPERALSRETARDLIDMLRGVVDRGTGTAVRTRFGVRGDVAGKTGTSQHNADGWFILMHPQLVAGAWVGFNDQRVTLRSNHWGQGGHNALLLVGDFFRQALRDKAIDAKARFPGPYRPAPPPEPPPDPWAVPAEAMVEFLPPAAGEGPPPMPRPELRSDIYVGRDGNGRLVVADRAGLAALAGADAAPAALSDVLLPLPPAMAPVVLPPR